MTYREQSAVVRRCTRCWTDVGGAGLRNGKCHDCFEQVWGVADEDEGGARRRD